MPGANEFAALNPALSQRSPQCGQVLSIAHMSPSTLAMHTNLPPAANSFTAPGAGKSARTPILINPVCIAFQQSDWNGMSYGGQVFKQTAGKGQSATDNACAFEDFGVRSCVAAGDTAIAAINTPSPNTKTTAGNSHRFETLSSPMGPISRTSSSPRSTLTISVDCAEKAQTILCIIGTINTIGGIPLRASNPLFAFTERRSASQQRNPSQKNKQHRPDQQIACAREINRCGNAKSEPHEHATGHQIVRADPPDNE